MSYPRGLRVARIIIWLFPFALLAWIASENLAPFGTTTLRCTVSSCDKRMSNFASKEPEILIGKPKEDGKPYRVITQYPVYFNSTLFRPMRRATVRLIYQPIVPQALKVGVFGVGTGIALRDFADHTPAITAIADSEEWAPLREGNDVLFTRQKDGLKRYGTLREFFANPPPIERIATYGLELPSYLPLPSYKPSGGRALTGATLRGAHTFLVYAAEGERVSLEVGVRDPNTTSGGDDLYLEAFRGPDSLAAAHLADDGDVAASKKPSGVRDLSIAFVAPADGTYRIALTARGDAPLIKSLTASQPRFAVQKKLSLQGAPDAADPVTVFVSGGSTLSLLNHSSLLPQTVLVGKTAVKFTKDAGSATVKLEPADGPVPIVLPTRSVTLESDGVFVFRAEDEIPTLRRAADSLSASSDLDRYDYLFARFPPFSREGDWFVAEQTIDLPQGRTVPFLITGDASPTHALLRLKELTVRLGGDPLNLSTVKNLFRRFMEKFRSGTL